MAASQTSTRRRGSRSGPEEWDGPPSKKPKIDTTKTASVGTKSSYSQDADGFSFTKKTKKPVKLQQQHAEQSNTATTKAARPTRRSARLSGEKAGTDDTPEIRQPTGEQVPATANRTRRKTQTPPPPNDSPTMTPGADGGIRVEKKRTPARIALPFADTPIIDKNIEMRRTNGQSRRRSSSTMRGRRASSLIGSGASTAVPHHEVAIADFFKHIAEDLPEPHRMKQLIIWCGSRALMNRPADASEDTSAVLAARVIKLIQDELLKDFASRSEMSNWYDREDLPPEILVKKSNPRNQQNAIKLVELEDELRRLEAEKQSWSSLFSDLETKANSLILEKPEEEAPIDTSVIQELGQNASLTTLDEVSHLHDEVKRRIEKATRSLEFNIDSVADGIHSLAKFKAIADQSSTKVATEAAEASRRKVAEIESRNSTDKAGVGDILRAFSRAGR